MFFVTHHGTLLCLDAEQRIVQKHPTEIVDWSELLELSVPAASEGCRYQSVMCDDTSGSAEIVVAGPLAGCLIHSLEGGRTVAFSENGSFITALPDQPVIVRDRSEIQGWETFLCLSRESLSDLLVILRNDWVIGSTKEIVQRSHVNLDTDYRLRIGPVELDLRFNLPFHEITRPTPPTPDDTGFVDQPLLSAVVLLDGWRVERITLYRPLIFLTVFNSQEYLDQATSCLTSLVEFGGYDGDVHIISEFSREHLLSLVPALDASKVTVQTIPAVDWVGYVASKYCILEHPAAHSYQPLLFLDPDIIVDADLSPMLATAAVSQRIMAPMEDFSSLSTNPSVGASLIQLAGGGVPHYASGFNAGTLAIPNLRNHGVTLRLIRSIVINRISIASRDSLRWVDQEVANYVSFAIGNFDTSTLLRYVRYGWPMSEFDATRRIGLIHFFPPRGPVSKSEAMRIYMQTLRSADASKRG